MAEPGIEQQAGRTWDGRGSVKRGPKATLLLALALAALLLGDLDDLCE